MLTKLTHRTRADFLAVTLLAAALAGCFDRPKPGPETDAGGTNDGRLGDAPASGSADGSRTDASGSRATDGAGGKDATSLDAPAITPDAPAITPGDPVDAPAITPRDALPGDGVVAGGACTSDTDCAAGPCVDGVCCAGACSGACTSCAQLYTGKPDGTCAPVTAGKIDPRGTCKDETASNECGGDGTCDGAGACRKVGTEHVCKAAACNGSILTPTSTCDGKGACEVVKTQDCGTAACDVVDGCRTVCAQEKDCPSTSYCNSTTKRCAAKRIAGDSCGGAIECSSGFCVDGVCCNTACTDKCMACTSSLTTGKSGVCSPVKVGSDPHNSCEVDATNPCGADGMCDGAGACRMTGTDQVCKAAACKDGSFVHAANCNGKGACGSSTTEDCGGYTCSATGGCQKSCLAESDCSAQSYCDLTAKTCSSKKDNGGLCKAGNECTSGNCVDGMCCNSKCDGACTSCKKAHTNGADGTCAAVAKGQDPYNSCQDETAANKCGNTGMCDGKGACQKVESGTICKDPSCAGSAGAATYTPASRCDGTGNCTAATVSSCKEFTCSPATGCRTTCSGDGDCSTSTFCDLSLATPVCTTKLALGSTCGNEANKCASGRCVDGVCCESACTCSCYACNVSGSAGKCTAVPAKSDDPKHACAGTAGNTTCGQNGTCNGNGSCYVAPAGTTGADCKTECSGSTIKTSSCDGKGSCASSSKACDNNLICASSSSCKTSCSDSSDCTGGLTCPVYGPKRCSPAGVEAQYAWNTSIHKVFTGDFNKDGVWDIGVTNGEGEPGPNGVWHIRYGDGSGGFSATDDIVFTWNNGSHNIFTGDFNGDGYWDIGVTSTGSVVESGLAGLWFIRYNNKAGGFSTTDDIQYTWNTGNHNVFTGDFNGDGYTDIGIADTATDPTDPPGMYWIRYNDKAGGFADDAHTVSFQWESDMHNVFTGDFDGDGKADIGLTNTSVDGVWPVDSWWIRNSTEGFAPPSVPSISWRVGNLYNVFTGKFFRNDSRWHVGLTSDGTPGSTPAGVWYIH